MPDNLPVSEPVFNALPELAVVALSGIDACVFAQAQFANDVLALVPGHWQWNCWLSPKGRVLAVFALLKRAPEELLLIVPDYQGDSLPLALQRFVFRRKLTIRPRNDLVASGAFAAVPQGPTAQIATFDEHLLLDFGGAGGARSLRIGSQVAASNESFVQRWRQYDLRHGMARLPAGQLDRWTPQQLSLDRLHAYSVRKGCYPGQEIVARTHFLGKAKRGLALFEAAGPLAAGDTIEAAGREVGEIVSATTEGSASLALAVLPLDREPRELQTGGNTLIGIPLLPGLGRDISA